jgi:cytochrome b561
MSITANPSKAVATEYGPAAIALHWLVVLLLLIQFALAWTMPDIHRGTRPVGLIELHLSFGVLIFAVAAGRLLLRIRYPVRLVVAGRPRWQYPAAWATHWLLYLVLIILPLLGWANASARGWTPRIFGLIPLPQILPTGSALGRSLGDFHAITAYALLALIGLHVIATFYHEFWLVDGTLLRMMPRLRKPDRTRSEVR